MEEKEIRKTISNYIKEEFLNEDDAITFGADTPLVSSRIMDSISTLQLVDFVEKTFGIEFSHHEVDQDNLDTVNKIYAFIERKKG
ncbi:MAG: acyl carrier protein [Saprospirales bacterium]|nr:MAG: acyl carrier protein [Saprospirales bacterium]